MNFKEYLSESKKTSPTDIVNMYAKLIKIQTTVSPQAVKGLQVKEGRWEKIVSKMGSGKKLTKLENQMVDQIEGVMTSLEKYVSELSKIK